jgi:hypothetical protein
MNRLLRLLRRRRYPSLLRRLLQGLLRFCRLVCSPPSSRPQSSPPSSRH